jgi:hypothetical protein
MEQLQTTIAEARSLNEIIKEIAEAVAAARAAGGPIGPETIKDLRWKFDQVSAKMNQAIYNDQTDLIHKTCLETVAVLVEMLARS